ncbi:T9SS type A sorting domain-containing protein [Nonlabens marinus]|uniref:Secretion system C-terminal sorting domain-containing protein n=1 Tax=Nonlabens marinus S1-08 TaxID=1454201 RepID=W8VRP2_9FLAO|nr:T9SS type A sorting domain-containing protein [Nonlabens marinus]BAO56399.1 hypothetical protein NMS_2390 [Nonlabens marinus S1-08]
MKNFTLPALVALFLGLGINCVNAQLVTKTVDDGTDGTLRKEIADTGSGGTITFDPSIQGQTINVTMGEIAINSFINFTINGDNAGTRTRISGTNSSRIFNISANVASSINLNDLILQDGTATNGGAIAVSGTTTVLNLSDVNFINNTATGVAASNGGGALWNSGSTVIIAGNSEFTGNSATGTSGSGGAILNGNGGILDIDSAAFTNNTANRAGGAIEDLANAAVAITIDNATFTANNAGSNPGNGGALHVSGSSSYTFTNVLFQENIAGKEGGALWNNQGVLTINGGIIRNNDARGSFVAGTPPEIVGGGGIFAEDGSGSVVINSGTLIDGNIATGVQGSGGGILMATGTRLTINGTVAEPVIISNNRASRAGGGLEDWSLNTSTNSLTNVQFTGNSAGVSVGSFSTNGGPGNGGAIHVTGPGSNTITGGSATNNTAANEGGGLWNGSGTMTVSGVTINTNTAAGSDTAVAGASGGGGIYNEGGTLVLEQNTLVTNNLATGAQSTGGGILNAAGTFTATDSEISGNESNRAGGGIETNGTSSVTLTNVTLNENSTGVITGAGAPGNGGGLHVSGSGSVDVNGGTVNTNTAANEGGGLWNGSGTMTVSGVTINSNTAAGSDTAVAGASGGGGIYNEGGTLVLEQNTAVTNNLATGAQSTGGGVLNAAGTFTATDSEISGNESNRAGGGIETNGDSSVTLSNVTLDGNITGVVVGAGAPGNGGGLHVSGAAPVTITGGTVSGNIAAKEGGGLWNNQGVLTINGTMIANNDAQGDFVAGMPPEIVGGGGIFAEDGAGSVIINEGTTIDANLASGAQGSGGGILMATGTTLTINGTAGSPVVISNNRASRAGGGLEDWSLATNSNSITNTNFTGNTAGLSVGTFTANGGPGNGGAIHVTGPGNNAIVGGEFSSNDAANEGGGLWNGSGTMTVSGATINANTAAGSDTAVAGASGGGGIYNEGGTLVLEQSTVVTNNQATGAQSTGGGVLNAAGTFTATDSEISGNESNRAGGGIETNGDSSVTLTNVTLDGNTTGVVVGAGAPGNGGGLHVSGAAPVTITGGTVSGNIAAKEGGGLWNNQGVLTINGTMITNNDAQGDFVSGMPPEIVGGGGIFAEDGTGSVIINEGTTIDANLASGVQGSGGGILMATGTTLTINGTAGSPVVVSNNRASRAGGGLEDWSLGATTSTLTNVNFTSNTAGLDMGGFTANGGPGNGGAIHVTGPGIVNVTGGTSTSNSAALEGGGFWNNVGTMSLSNVALSNNTAIGAGADDGGGALFNNGGTLNIDALTITDNLATGASGSGGALLSTDGAVSILNSTITGNAANRAGGAIEIINGTLDVNNSDISGNDVNGTAGTAAPGNGGALHISGVTVVNINTSTINNNAAAAEGGALWNQTGSQMIVSNSTIDGNSANGTAVDNGGGGIFINGGDTQVYDTTISNNSANGSNGGGISNQGGTLIVETSTISSNSSTVNGGGVFNAGTSATFDIVTVARNNATSTGGGLSSIAGTFTIKNTLVAENTAASSVNVSGIASDGYNLIEIDDANSFDAMATDIEGSTASPAFASLGPLQDNGGNTFTHALMNGTRAQDAGEPGNNLTDQRGEPVFGPSRDIGSYEAQATLSTDYVNQALAGLRLYPNPSRNGGVNLDLPNSLVVKASYKVMDMTGKMVAQAPLQTGSNQLQLENLSTGIYIVRVNAGNQSHSLKLIRE